MERILHSPLESTISCRRRLSKNLRRALLQIRNASCPSNESRFCCSASAPAGCARHGTRCRASSGTVGPLQKRHRKKSTCRPSSTSCHAESWAWRNRQPAAVRHLSLIHIFPRGTFPSGPSALPALPEWPVPRCLHQSGRS